MAMTKEKVLEALVDLEGTIRKFHAIPKLEPIRLSEDELKKPKYAIDHHSRMQHYLFMVIEAQRMMCEEPMRREKVMRWLGFLQGVLFELGLKTIDESKQANRPNS